MQTDIRKMIEGLRPVADFRDHVERTIKALNTIIEDTIPLDEEDQQDLTELCNLVEFWSNLLAGMDKE